MFTQAPHQPPRFRALLGGAIAFCLFLALLWQLSAVTKYLGLSLLYLPAQLGIVRQVTAQDVQRVQAAGWVTLRVATPGPYHVYLDSYDFLTQTDADLAAGKRPWLLVEALPTHQSLAVEYVTRGLRIYDTPFAGGRPAFSVSITRPGEYRVSARKAAALWLVPDYTSGHETSITLAIIAELAALVLVSGCIWYWSDRGQRRARGVQMQRDQERQTQAEGFWQREKQRRKKSDQ